VEIKKKVERKLTKFFYGRLKFEFILLIYLRFKNLIRDSSLACIPLSKIKNVYRKVKLTFTQFLTRLLIERFTYFAVIQIRIIIDTRNLHQAWA